MTTIRHVPTLPLPVQHGIRVKSLARDRRCDQSTVRYLGVEVDDALEIAEKIDV